MNFDIILLTQDISVLGTTLRKGLRDGKAPIREISYCPKGQGVGGPMGHGQPHTAYTRGSSFVRTYTSVSETSTTEQDNQFLFGRFFWQIFSIFS